MKKRFILGEKLVKNISFRPRWQEIWAEITENNTFQYEMKL